MKTEELCHFHFFSLLICNPTSSYNRLRDNTPSVQAHHPSLARIDGEVSDFTSSKKRRAPSFTLRSLR